MRVNRGLCHASVSKPVKNVDIAGRTFRGVLQHRAGHLWQSSVYLAEKQRQEVVLSVAQSRDNVEYLSELIMRARGERRPGSRLHRECFGEVVCDAEQLLEETKALQAQISWEMCNHWQKGVRELSIMAVVVCKTQLPGHVLEPVKVD